MDHLGDNTAANLLQGVLSSQERRAVEEHLDTCSSCRTLLASLADNVTSATVVDGKQRRRTTIVRGSGAVAQLGQSTRIISVGTAVAQRYLLQEQLGAGGMGSVWGALDNKLNRQVAVKMLHGALEGETELTRRFHGEAMAIAQLKSLHIVQIFDYGVDGSSPFIVMERLDGEDLHTRARRGRLSSEEVVDLVEQVALGLSAAHSSGLVHRDLKPGNIFLERTQGGVSAKVIDFGIAKTLDTLSPLARTTADGQIIGTPRYMSPEQLRADHSLDHRSDLWSLAVIVYRLLTERYPFNAATPTLLIGEVLHEEPEPPSVLDEALPDALDTFFERALAKEPAARFQSATDLAQALRDACFGTDGSASTGSAVHVSVGSSSAGLAGAASEAFAPPLISSKAPTRSRLMMGAVMAIALGVAGTWLLFRPSERMGVAESGGTHGGEVSTKRPEASRDLVATAPSESAAGGTSLPDASATTAAHGTAGTAPRSSAAEGLEPLGTSDSGMTTEPSTAAPAAPSATLSAPRPAAVPVPSKAPPNPADLFDDPMFFDGGAG